MSAYAAVEDFVQQEGRAFFGSESFQYHQEGDRQVGGELALRVGRRGDAAARDRLGQPRADIGFAFGARRAQAVDAKPSNGGHQPGLRA